MAIYLVTPLSSNFDQLGQALREVVPANDSHELQHRAGYLVSFQGTSVELSNKLGITSEDPAAAPPMGSTIVTSVGSYYGRGSTAMWEWLKVKIEGR